ncbi:hypothetical protein Bbelb_050970 [Branchiostoma belcheri]|nr:hypothetical protein Bbelb_050970 [Branchiostoma belcheri]
MTFQSAGSLIGIIRREDCPSVEDFYKEKLSSYRVEVIDGNHRLEAQRRALMDAIGKQHMSMSDMDMTELFRKILLGGFLHTSEEKLKENKDLGGPKEFFIHVRDKILQLPAHHKKQDLKLEEIMAIESLKIYNLPPDIRDKTEYVLIPGVIPEAEDMVQNSSKALMWEGLCHLARRDCVREGDGPASIGTWMLSSFGRTNTSNISSSPTIVLTEKNSNNFEEMATSFINTYSSKYLRPFFRTTKDMTPSHRLDLLTDAMVPNETPAGKDSVPKDKSDTSVTFHGPSRRQSQSTSQRSPISCSPSSERPLARCRMNQRSTSHPAALNRVLISDRSDRMQRFYFDGDYVRRTMPPLQQRRLPILNQLLPNSIIKYFSGTRGFLPARLRHGLIWNRTGNIKGGPGKNVGLNLINEFLNNDFKVDCWNVERKLGDDIKYVGKKEHMGHILPSLLNFPFKEIVPDVLHMVVVWAINQRRTDELMRAMKDTDVPFRIMETAGDDGKGSARTWTQLNGKEVIRLRAAMVDEWLNNESKYKAYVPDINFRDEAPRYLLHQFDGDMGDLMATADFLRRTINIVSTSGDEDSCFIIVEPSDGNTALDPATGSGEGVFRDEESSITEDLDRAEAQLLQFVAEGMKEAVMLVVDDIHACVNKVPSAVYIHVYSGDCDGFPEGALQAFRDLDSLKRYLDRYFRIVTGKIRSGEIDMTILHSCASHKEERQKQREEIRDVTQSENNDNSLKVNPNTRCFVLVTYYFLAALVYILSAVDIRKCFQQKNLDLTEIQRAVEAKKEVLRLAREEPLDQHLGPEGRLHGMDIQEFAVLRRQFVDFVIENLEDRFPQMDLLSAFSFLDPSHLPV